MSGMSKGMNDDDYKKTQEFRTYERLKGNLIRIYPSGNPDRPWIGKLVWVNRYTLGVAFEWERDHQAISIVYKDGLRIDPHVE